MAHALSLRAGDESAVPMGGGSWPNASSQNRNTTIRNNDRIKRTKQRNMFNRLSFICTVIANLIEFSKTFSFLHYYCLLSPRPLLRLPVTHFHAFFVSDQTLYLYGNFVKK